MKKRDAIEVREVSENEILDEVIVHRKFNSEWLKDCFIRGIPGFNFIKDKNKDRFWLWLFNGSVVGFSYLKEVEDLEARISFKVKDDFDPSEEVLQEFIEKTILGSFETWRWEKILYDCGDQCSTPIARTFLQSFEPHPVGWVHLNEGKFVLTRGQIDHTEEEFYKI